MPTSPDPQESSPPFLAVLVAAGRSRRMGEGVRKLWLELAGLPVLGHSLRACARARGCQGVAVVTSAEDHAAVQELASLVGWSGPLELVLGGAERLDSVRAGVAACASMAPGPHVPVLVHDAARPLVAAGEFERVAAAIAESGSALLAAPVRDSLHRERDGHAAESVAREGLWAAETPQGARLDLLTQALAAFEGPATDEAAVLAAAGHPARLVQAEASHPKLTWPGDLPLLAALLEARAGRADD